MALVILNSGRDPLGQFDAVDSITTTVKGGEVLTFTTVTVASDHGAADTQDGYLNPGTSRVALTNAVTSSTKPLMLCDDGTTHYGTVFGVVVGGTVGQTSFGPNSTVPASAQLGPHTAFGSGKLTAWDKPGLYGVTLDACDTTASTGLQPTNTSLTSGAALYATVAASVTSTRTLGQLTPLQSNSDPLAGYFVEFRTNGSLVSTPNRLVSALNSPSSTVSGTLPNTMYMAVFHFNG